MVNIAQFWVGVASNIAVALGLFFVWYRLREYVKDELSYMSDSIKKDLTREEGEIMGGHADNLEEYFGKHDKLRSDYDACISRIDKRHKVDVDINEQGHTEIKETLRLLVKSTSVILETILPLANGNGQTVTKMKGELDNHLLDKI